MLIEKVPASKLNPAAYNPRKDLKPGDKEYEKYPQLNPDKFKSLGGDIVFQSGKTIIYRL